MEEEVPKVAHECELSDVYLCISCLQNFVSHVYKWNSLFREKVVLNLTSQTCDTYFFELHKIMWLSIYEE